MLHAHGIYPSKTKIYCVQVITHIIINYYVYTTPKVAFALVANVAKICSTYNVQITLIHI